MARNDTHRHARRRRRTQERYGNSIPRHRSHRRFAAHRTPCRRHDAASLPACRTPAHSACRRRHRHDRRPVHEEPGAQAHRRGDTTPQPGVHKGAARKIPRLRKRRPQRRSARQQLRLDEGFLLPGLYTRRRQAHHRKLHDGKGLGQKTPVRREPRGHVVHRILVPAASGLRLPAPVRQIRLPHSARRFGSVGQHDHRHRTDTPHARRRGCLRHNLQPHHQSRRHKIRQDRRRQRMA